MVGKRSDDLQGMSRRRFPNNLAALGASAGPLISMTRDSSAKLTDDPEDNGDSGGYHLKKINSDAYIPGIHAWSDDNTPAGATCTEETINRFNLMI